MCGSTSGDSTSVGTKGGSGEIGAAQVSYWLVPSQPTCVKCHIHRILQLTSLILCKSFKTSQAFRYFKCVFVLCNLTVLHPSKMAFLLQLFAEIFSHLKLDS